MRVVYIVKNVLENTKNKVFPIHQNVILKRIFKILRAGAQKKSVLSVKYTICLWCFFLITDAFYTGIIYAGKNNFNNTTNNSKR